MTTMSPVRMSSDNRSPCSTGGYTISPSTRSTTSSPDRVGPVKTCTVMLTPPSNSRASPITSDGLSQFDPRAGEQYRTLIDPPAEEDDPNDRQDHQDRSQANLPTRGIAG